MEVLQDWDALRHCVGNVDRGAPGYTTNLYASRGQIESWCVVAPLQSVATDRAVLVLRHDRDFQRVYHAAADAAALTEALQRLPAGTYVTDLVGQSEMLERACAAYADAGFTHHSFLRRMNGAGRTEANSGQVDLARPEDAAAIATFLERLLDRFTEQVPDIPELAEAAAAERLLLVRRDDRLAGMLLYELKGQLAHLRFWHVDQDARGEGVGRRLMSSFLSRCAQARRIVLWVIGDNERSIAIYRHYGFSEDGLLDKVMILQKDRQQ